MKNMLNQENLPLVIENNTNNTNGEAYDKQAKQPPQDIVQPGLAT
jgi:hypothetical protein